MLYVVVYDNKIKRFFFRKNAMKFFDQISKASPVVNLYDFRNNSTAYKTSFKEVYLNPKYTTIQVKDKLSGHFTKVDREDIVTEGNTLTINLKR